MLLPARAGALLPPAAAPLLLDGNTATAGQRGTASAARLGGQLLLPAGGVAVLKGVGAVADP